MNKNEAFKKIIEVISSSDIKSEGGYVIIDLKKDYNEAEQENLKEIISSIGYTKKGNPFENNNQLWLDKRAMHWTDGECLFYSNLDSLWQKCYRADSLPDLFYTISEKTSFLDIDNDENLIKFNLYFSWKILLLKLADHYANDFFVFFMLNDKGGDKLEIESTLELSQLPELDNPKIHLDTAIDLQNKLDFKDLHQLERRSVMRATLSEITKENVSDSCILEKLLSLTVLFNNKYNELYEIYTKRFSVNKLLNELDEKSLEFTSKINEFISSSQTKALTIPGALIAVGALAKVDAALESFIIIGGLWMIKKVNNSSNEVYREAFIALDNRLNNAFQKYLKFHNELEVKKSAADIKSELSTLISKSSKRLETLDRLASFMFYGGAIYLSIKLFNLQFYKELKIMLLHLIKYTWGN
ncbi:hypothetical protein [Pectobacterium brasiliense]|uniref:hypothetical protein n=1 Tax=Pectobacterium brasiliense TaxID=180957 RepID=UPI0015DFA373|nr:hypothetical protein [Pectobacterium brasiliense]MBA0208198.1 hypothetical protein [Pectobacterium brasiliense]